MDAKSGAGEEERRVGRCAGRSRKMVGGGERRGRRAGLDRDGGMREGDAAGRWRSLPEREEISPEEKLGMAGDGDGGGGAAIWRRRRQRRPEAAATAAAAGRLHDENQRTRQGEAADTAAARGGAAAVAAAVAAVGLPPCSSLSSHLR